MMQTFLFMCFGFLIDGASFLNKIVPVSIFRAFHLSGSNTKITATSVAFVLKKNRTLELFGRSYGCCQMPKKKTTWGIP